MLKESRIFKFLDNTNQFTLAFVEGQKLVQDLALIHSLNQEGFLYIRDAVLSTIPMLSFLKNQEGLGLYIDNDSPYFRLKIEGHSSGAFRTLLLPEDVKSIPEKLNGISRFTKILPKNPYTSVIELKNKKFDEVINEVLVKSYQMNATIIISEDSDQSILISKLPDPNQNIAQDAEKNQISLREYKLKMQTHFNSIFTKGLNTQEKIQKEFENLGLIYLGNQTTKFSCPCSKERMVTNLVTLSDADKNDVFKSGSVEIKCDYCKTKYKIFKSDLDISFQ